MGDSLSHLDDLLIPFNRSFQKFTSRGLLTLDRKTLGLPRCKSYDIFSKLARAWVW